MSDFIQTVSLWLMREPTPNPLSRETIKDAKTRARVMRDLVTRVTDEEDHRLVVSAPGVDFYSSLLLQSIRREQQLQATEEQLSVMTDLLRGSEANYHHIKSFVKGLTRLMGLNIKDDAEDSDIIYHIIDRWSQTDSLSEKLSAKISSLNVELRALAKELNACDANLEENSMIVLDILKAWRHHRQQFEETSQKLASVSKNLTDLADDVGIKGHHEADDFGFLTEEISRHYHQREHEVIESRQSLDRNISELKAVARFMGVEEKEDGIILNDVRTAWTSLKMRNLEMEKELEKERKRAQEAEDALKAFLSRPKPSLSTANTQTDCIHIPVQTIETQTEEPAPVCLQDFGSQTGKPVHIIAGHGSEEPSGSIKEETGDSSDSEYFPLTESSSFVASDDEGDNYAVDDASDAIAHFQQESDASDPLSDLPSVSPSEASADSSSYGVQIQSMADLVPFDDKPDSIPELGKGSFGTVYLHRHAASNLPVALKVIDIPPKDDVEARAKANKKYILESKIQDALSGFPYFPDFYGAFRVAEDQLAIAMEFVGDCATCRGYSIRDKFDWVGPALSETDWLDVMIDVTQGLKIMHEQGFLNNDLKEDNVLLIEDGGRWRAKLIDFGMATTEPWYMNMSEQAKFAYEHESKCSHYAPECALDNVPTTESSDIYQLGRLLGFVGNEMEIDSLFDMGEFIMQAAADQRPALDTVLDELYLQRSGNVDYI